MIEIGKKYHKWTVLEYVEKNQSYNKIYKCQCDCGKIKNIIDSRLIHNRTKSCQQCANKTHGKTKSKEYKSWSHMKERCLNKKCKNYKNYGGRGIKVCKRWLDSFDNFYADMGDKPAGTTIDRIDNNGNYCPENCQWSTSKKQNRNRRDNRIIEYNGESLCVSEWAEKLGMKAYHLHNRIDKHRWSIEKALTIPIKNNGKQKKREYK